MNSKRGEAHRSVRFAAWLALALAAGAPALWLSAPRREPATGSHMLAGMVVESGGQHQLRLGHGPAPSSGEQGGRTFRFIAPDIVAQGEEFSGTVVEVTSQGEQPIAADETVTLNGEVVPHKNGRITAPRFPTQTGNHFLFLLVTSVAADAASGRTTRTEAVQPTHVEIIAPPASTAREPKAPDIQANSQVAASRTNFSVYGDGLTTIAKAELKDAEGKSFDLGEPLAASRYHAVYPAKAGLPSGKLSFLATDAAGKTYDAPQPCYNPKPILSGPNIVREGQRGDFSVGIDPASVPPEAEDTVFSVLVTGGGEQIKLAKNETSASAKTKGSLPFTAAKLGPFELRAAVLNPEDVPPRPDAPQVDVKSEPTVVRYDAGRDETAVQCPITVVDEKGKPVRDVPVQGVITHPKGVTHVRGKSDRNGRANLLTTVAGKIAAAEVATHVARVVGCPWKVPHEMCELKYEVKPGTGIGVKVIAPTSEAERESKEPPKAPLIVDGIDDDEVEQKCICHDEAMSTDVKMLDCVDSVTYNWAVLSGKGTVMPPSGPAVLFEPPELKVGETDTSTVEATVKDVRGNDAPAKVTFTIVTKRSEECKYTQKTTSKVETTPGGKLTPTGQGAKCKVLPHKWEPVPAELTGDAAGMISVCVGERKVINASGVDDDTLKMFCGGICGYDKEDASMIDETVYEWSATIGGFPDHGGNPTNSRRTTAIYMAPDEPGEGKITVRIRDSRRQVNDPVVTKEIRVKVYMVDLSIEDVPDEEEECAGGFVCTNRDDDNDNEKADRLENPVPGENELVKITLSVTPKEGSVTLKAKKGGDLIRVWDNPTKQKEVKLPKSFPAAELPESLWVEGIEISQEDRDILLALEHDQAHCEDVAAFTAVEILLYRGDVEATGRGAEGRKEEILHEVQLSDLNPSSLPKPHIVVENMTITGASKTSDGKLVAHVGVSGYAVAPAADVVPNKEADPKELVLSAGPVSQTTVQLRREDESPTILRPYAAKYRFSASIPNAPLLPHENVVSLSVTDPFLEQIGWTAARARLEASVEPSLLALVLNPPSLLEPDYATAWLRGPWTASPLPGMTRLPNGPYKPIVVRLRGPESALLSGRFKVNVFGQTHKLIKYEDWIVSAGQSDDKKPGVFVPGGRINWATGETRGAGHFSKQNGFVFIRLEQSLAGADKKTLGEAKLNILNTAEDLFRRMQTIAGQRYLNRLRGDPGKTYGPPYATGGADDPFKKITEWMFNEYAENLSAGKRFTKESVKKLALHRAPPSGINEPAGIPNGATQLYWDAWEKGHKSFGQLDLLGYYTPGVLDQEHDFSSQQQNVTNILHFNNGVGWRIRNYGQMFAEFVAIMTDETLTDAARHTKFLDWLDKHKLLPEKMQSDLSLGRTVQGDETVFNNNFGPGKKFEEKYKEFTDIAVIARAFGGANPSSLDVFIAYDLASFEAFHVFGIDPFNDVIATEAGRIFGERVEAGAAGPFANAGALAAEMSRSFLIARTAFGGHKVFGGKARARESFFSLMLATDAAGAFVPAEELHWHSTIWKSTLGTFLDKNKDKLKKPADRQKFAEDVIVHLIVTEKTNWKQVMAGIANTADDITSLHQMVEMLSFLND